MLPLIVELGIETLVRKLRAETVDSGGVVKTPELVGAWTRKR